MARSLLLPALVAAMETGWLMVWSILIGGWIGQVGDEPLLRTPAVFGLIAGGWATARMVLRRRWPLGRARAAVGGAAVLAALLAVRTGPLASYGLTDLGWVDALAEMLPMAFHRPQAAVLALALALYLWWRGLRRARQPLYPGDVEGAFQWGTLGIALGLVLRSAALGDAATGPTLAAVAIFLLTGFTALALAQVESMQGESRVRENAALPVNRHWLGLLLGIVGLMLIAAVVLAQLLSFGLLEALARPMLAVLLDVLLVALFIVAVPVGYVLEALLWVLRLIRGGAAPAEWPKIGPATFSTWRDQAQHAALSPDVVAIIKWVLVGLMAVAIVVVLIRSVYRLGGWETLDAVDEERDFVWSWPGLRAVVRRWLARWRRARPPTTTGAVSVRPDDGSRPEVVSLRAMYRELLRLGARLGRPRQPSLTPHEYARALSHGLDLDGAALNALTEAYVQARYGREPPDEATIATSRAAVERLRSRYHTVLDGFGGHPQTPARKGSALPGPSRNEGELPATYLATTPPAAPEAENRR